MNYSQQQDAFFVFRISLQRPRGGVSRKEVLSEGKKIKDFRPLRGKIRSLGTSDGISETIRLYDKAYRLILVWNSHNSSKLSLPDK